MTRMRTVRRRSSDGTDNRSRRSPVETKLEARVSETASRCCLLCERARRGPTRCTVQRTPALSYRTGQSFSLGSRLPAVSSSHAPSCVQDSVCSGGYGIDCCCRWGHAGALWTSYEGSEHENGARQLSPSPTWGVGRMHWSSHWTRLKRLNAHTYGMRITLHMSSSGV